MLAAADSLPSSLMPSPSMPGVHADTIGANYDALIVGGGFYGARLALMLRRHGARVLLIEREARLLGRASTVNQARVHNGYHYPRSVLTALRARVHYERFRAEYPGAIHDWFPKYYAIARRHSKVSAGRFRDFCERVGAPIERAPDSVQRLFDPRHVEAVFAVRECAFDADRLREIVTDQLAQAGVEVSLSTDARRYEPTPSGGVRLLAIRDGQPIEFSAQLLLNCTYAGLNGLLTASGEAPVALTCELTELALVEAPPPLDGIGVTVMDGPFFSLMPFPSRGLHSLSHVRYTPHGLVTADGTEAIPASAAPAITGRSSRAAHMLYDAARFLPAIAEARYVESVWEYKAILPRSAVDDSRPILLHASSACAPCYSVLGAKIDSVYDVEEALADVLSLVESPR